MMQLLCCQIVMLLFICHSMSQENTYRYSAGVVKIDEMAAGYPDLIKVANQWASDENFYEIIVRKVSETNVGIQFVHIVNLTMEEQKFDFFKEYVVPLQEQFGYGKGGVYAYDIDSKDKTGSELKAIMPVLKDMKF